MNHDEMLNIYVQYVILVNMYHFYKTRTYHGDTIWKKFIKTVEIVKHVVSELSSISSISCFDEEKCLFLETKLVKLNANFHIYSTSPNYVRVSEYG